jgi:predicted HTH domain antitoxin
MNNLTVSFDVPRDILYSLSSNVTDFIKDIRLYSALELFRKHKLSIGKAALLAEKSKEVFMDILAENNINFIDYSAEELKQEFKILK